MDKLEFSRGKLTIRLTKPDIGKALINVYYYKHPESLEIARYDNVRYFLEDWIFEIICIDDALDQLLSLNYVSKSELATWRGIRSNIKNRSII